MRFSPPLSLALGQSRRLLLLLLGAHAAVATAMLVARPDFVGALAAAIALWSGYDSITLHALRRAPRAVVALFVRPEGLVRIALRDGSMLQTQVRATSYVTPGLTVLNLRVESHAARRNLSIHVIIAPDAVDRDEFRRLRVWLRWGYPRKPAGPPGPPTESP